MRFAGDVGYVVTFRQIDPLYTLDLANPERPRLLGQLKIARYSAYLHPIGEDMLLGIGQAADEQGHPLGTQLSLFDVSNPAHPKRLQQAALGAGGPRRNPIIMRSSSGPGRGSSSSRSRPEPSASASAAPADSTRSAASRTARGRFDARSSSATRCSTGSDAGVTSSSLAKLEAQGWVAFPAPAQPVPKTPVPVAARAGGYRFWPCRRGTVVEPLPPADQDLVNGGRTDDLRLGHLELRGMQDERPRLRAADAAVERDQLLERAAGLHPGVVEAADHDVGDVVESVRAEEMLRRIRREAGQRVVAVDRAVGEVAGAAAAEHDGPCSEERTSSQPTCG